MGIKFKQIDNLQNTFDSMSGGLQGQITRNINDISGVYNDSQILSGWKYFANNIDISGAQGLLVQNDNIYTPNNLIAGGVKIGFSISSPRNSTVDPLGVLQVTGGQIYFEDQLNIRNDSDIVISNGSITANEGVLNSITGSSVNYTSGIFESGLTISGISVTTGQHTHYSAASGVSLISDTFITSGTGSFEALGLGTNNPQSILDISSISSAPIMPRMTTAQMNAITSPVEGMLIYNNDSGKFAGYQADGWAIVSSGASTASAGGLSSSEVTRLQHFLSYWVVDSAGSLIPTGDNAQDLGSASNQIRDSFIDPS